jgi:2-hydroxychromene-2-carboxylate isomerase
MIVSLQVTHFSDPGCPWAWSASPPLAALVWRYGDQLEWRNVMIGLAEFGTVYEERGYTAAAQARGFRTFRERGMPFATEPRAKVHGTWPMCRVVVATRRLSPDREYAVFRALQLAQFTSTLDLEDLDDLKEAISWVPGIDAGAIIAASTEPETETLFEQDRNEARTAANSPTEFQNKHANSDGRVRYTAPSLKLKNAQGVTLEAGGFQSFEAYDVLIANLDQSLERRAPATDATEVLNAFPDGLTTAEVALIMTEDKYAPDLNKAEDALIAALGEGATRLPFGHDALWIPAAPVALTTAA